MSGTHRTYVGRLSFKNSVMQFKELKIFQIQV
jgi:hypothetical protein